MSIGIFRNFVFTVAAAILLMPGPLFAKELLPLRDPAQLKMKVTGTEVVDGLSSETEQARFLAGKGKKIVVVTLKGNTPRACSVSFKTSEFAAAYEEEVTNHDGTKERRSGIASAVAIASGDSWSISPDITTMLNFYKAGPLVLKFAFVVPDAVNDFLVRYPTLAGGKAVIPGNKQ